MDYEFDFGSRHVRGGVVDDAAVMAGKVIIPCQTHGCRIAVIDGEGKVPALDDTDGIISLAPDIRIGVRTADCVPIVLFAPDIMAVAAVHAGWKGTLGGIADVAVEKLGMLGASPAAMMACFGPGICGGCYEVSHELAGDFASAGFSDSVIGERNVDLEAVNISRLVAAGVLPANIHPRRYCTLETPAFPSWRRNYTTRRLLTWVGLVSGD